jgi:hypothetical protein
MHAGVTGRLARDVPIKPDRLVQLPGLMVRDRPRESGVRSIELCHAGRLLRFDAGFDVRSEPALSTNPIGKKSRNT